MYKQPSNRSKSALRSNKSFQPLLPHESSIQYLNFLDTSSQKKDAYESPTKKILANIDIYIRIRPFLKKELISITNKKNPQFLRVPNSQTLQIVDREHQDSRQYEFHEIFNEETSQNEIFHRTCKPILDNVLQGYNAAMFVYGQTGTGKTYTMGILDRINEKSEGLVPSALKYLFRNFDGYNQDQCELSMSFYQIYLEEIQDLLNPSEGRNLGIGEDKNTGESYIKGLTVVTLQNLSQAFQLINAGLSFRNMEATKHNETSSRSHVILTINILQRKEFGESMTFSKANFIDLAGSEKPSKHSESMGGSKIDRRYEETKFINSSLSTLGTVIASLNEKGRDVTSHVAFRNSKLTRVLQSCLNGNSKVLFLIF